MSGKRYIRLKELGVDIQRVYKPAKEYLTNCPKLNPDEVFFIETDNDGNQVSIYRNDSMKKIYLLGASTVESLYIRQSQKPQSVLEKLLLEQGYNYSVKNLGVSGTQTLNIINVLINKLGDSEGSIVVITLPSNDLGPLIYQEGYYSSHKYHSSIVPASDIKVKKNTVLNLKKYEQNLNFIKVVCDLLSLKLVFVSVCYNGSDNNLRMLNQVAREYCQKNNVRFLDIENSLSSSTNFFYDKLHFLPEGAMFFTKEVLNFLHPLLIKDESKKLEVFPFSIRNQELGKVVSWSRNIVTEQVDKVILTLKFKQIDSDATPALYAVDYGCTPEETNLVKSANKDIGYYKYIEGASEKILERSYDIYIPKNCKNMKIGLRSWGGRGVYIYDAFLSVITLKNKEA